MFNTRPKMAKWKLYSRDDLRANILEVDNSPYPGLGHSTFQLKLDSDMYRPGDIVSSYLYNNEVMYVVDKEPLLDGTTVYKVCLVTNDGNKYIPRTVLARGSEIYRRGCTVSELPSGVETREQWQIIRKLSKNRYK